MSIHATLYFHINAVCDTNMTPTFNYLLKEFYALHERVERLRPLKNARSVS